MDLSDSPMLWCLLILNSNHYNRAFLINLLSHTHTHTHTHTHIRGTRTWDRVCGWELGVDLHQNKSFVGINFIITVRKRSLRRLCFHRCLSVHRGVYPIACRADTPLGRHSDGQTHFPTWEDTPRADTPWQTPPRHTLPPRHTPPWQTPPGQTHSSSPAWWMLGYGQQAGGTHPNGMHPCYQLRTHGIPLAPMYYNI